ncbi:MAG TPA: TonB-dependent receptor, partial [Saprospiraceae bacterium]|nr:TonB-dependent receptor [Saprospiraceae bacterium]
TGLFLLLSGPSLFSQQKLYGIVTNEREELLVGATVHWKGTSVGAITDTLGRFYLPHPDTAAVLMVHYIGYNPVEVNILPEEDSVWVEISGVVALQIVTVSAAGFDNAVSTLHTRNVESINSQELRKAPCCNLSESFTTNGAVDLTYADAVTGVKEIQMLGLRGVYSQFMIENRPTLGGIATPFAFEMIPGTWLGSIQLAKGASTVKNGAAGITGQVNAELVKPATDKPLFVNAFGSSEGRGELNVHLNRKGSGHFSNGLLLHGSFVENRWDMNNDNFYDSPNRQQLNGLYRLFYESPTTCGQLNIQALTDRRSGGQISALDGATERFAVDQRNDRVEVWGKVGQERLFGKPYNQIGNMFSASWHRFDADYGHNAYAATQQSLYWQTLVESIIGTTDHKIVLAPSIQYDNIRERVNEGVLDRREFVPGAMAEYTYSRPNLRLDMPDLVVVLGARLDWNSRFERWLFTPRMSAKYNFTQNSVVRVSAGRGFRSPNLMAENISVLASNRALHFADGLGLEEAWNYGINYTQNFKVFNRDGNLSIDAYRTDFQRQILVDVDQSATDVFFYNANGAAYANSILAVLQYSP